MLPWRETPELNPEPLRHATENPELDSGDGVPTSFSSGDTDQLARLATCEPAPLRERLTPLSVFPPPGPGGPPRRRFDL